MKELVKHKLKPDEEQQVLQEYAGFETNGWKELITN